MSYLIVSISLGIPSMIIAETALSFLRIGIQPPSISWGVLLQSAQSIRALNESPWLLIPGLFIVITVLSFNFVGDGLERARKKLLESGYNLAVWDPRTVGLIGRDAS